MKINIQLPPHRRQDRGSAPQDLHYLEGGHLCDVRGPFLWESFLDGLAGILFRSRPLAKALAESEALRVTTAA
eukprot:623447-Pyramimonas_sp.AAC.1